MDFTKTTLAVALGILIAPILLCGGCLMITAGTGAVGIVSHGESIAEAREADRQAKKQEQIQQEAEQNQLAQQLVEQSHSRHASEFATYNTDFEQYTSASETVDLTKSQLADWLTANPKPETPVYSAEQWTANPSGKTISAKAIAATRQNIELLRQDGETFTVDVYKLEAASRIRAWAIADELASYREALAEWTAKQQELQKAAKEAVAAVPPKPTEPDPALTLEEALQSLQNVPQPQQ